MAEILIQENCVCNFNHVGKLIEYLLQADKVCTFC